MSDNGGHDLDLRFDFYALSDVFRASIWKKTISRYFMIFYGVEMFQ